MKKRREAQSSALSFMDCICCGFGAVLLLFILTAKKQMIVGSADANQAQEAAETLEAAIEEARLTQQALDQELAALDPKIETSGPNLSELAAEQERLTQAIAAQSSAIQSLEENNDSAQEQPGLDRPSADQSYLSGLKLRGPQIVILLESSGSMLASNAGDAIEIIHSGSWKKSEKWLRSKKALRAVLAAIPKGNKVAVLSMGETATALSGSPDDPYIDPYDNPSLISLLARLEDLEAKGGANLAEGLRTAKVLPKRASSLLVLGDGLPTSPAPTNGRLSEQDRVRLFNQAFATRPKFPVNAILFPFEGDPSAAGLFWQLSGQTNGITLIPDNDWPAL